MVASAGETVGMKFWRDTALPFIEARSVRDGRNVCYAKHWHETFSIGLISQGRCSYFNGGQTRQVSAGTVVLMNPGDVHACNPIENEPWSYTMLYLDVDWLRDTLGAENQHPSQAMVSYSTIATVHRPLYDALNTLARTLFDPQVDKLEKHGASVLFAQWMHSCLPEARPPIPARRPALQRAADFIRDNCRRSLSVEEICRHAHLSASHLIRAFKQAYGLTPHAFQISCRIEACRAQLRAGRSIAEVAADSGFSDQAHFQRTFKKLVAATPGQYRGAPPDA